MTVPSIITSNSITVLVNGKTLVAKVSHPNFETIKSYLKRDAACTPDYLASLFDIPKAIETRSNGRVTIVANNGMTEAAVLYDGKPLHNTLTQRMIQMLSEGFNIDPLINFLEKLMQNPSHRAVNGLYDFLAATNIPITPEGDFLAYKKVRNNYYDIYSGTIRNAVGDEPRVNRNQVDEDPDRTCSHGLHVCSESYLGHFGSYGSGDRVVIVQVNPADVVAIPRDYNNAKMRCAGYKVIGEVPASEVSKTFTSAVMGSYDFRVPVEDLNDEVLTADETEVIRNIDGLVVTFKYEDDDGWVAYFTDNFGNDDEYASGERVLDDAVQQFREDVMEEVEDYTAEVRWLDDDGELHIETIRVTWDADESPDASAFADEVVFGADFDVPDDARFVNIQQVPGSRRWVLQVW